MSLKMYTYKHMNKVEYWWMESPDNNTYDTADGTR